MAYEYINPKREEYATSLPDVEIFEARDCAEYEGEDGALEDGWYYAYGFPGCLWDGDPVGPYSTEREALEAAREDSGFYVW